MSTARKQAGSAQTPPFAPGDLVVYRGHGVGRVTAIESQTVGGAELKLVVVGFDQDGMVARIPLAKIESAGLRALSSTADMGAALARLGQPAAKVVSSSGGMWNRRLVDYTARINSGDPMTLAGLVHELHRGPGARERSTGEQTVYEKAFGRLSEELAAVDGIDRDAAAAKLDRVLNGS